MKVVSWNVKGLRSHNKHMAILRHLKRLKADIALLQKTHLKTEDFNCMCKLWVRQVFGSPAVKGKAGVLLLINKNLSCEAVQEDSEGWILTVRLKQPTREWVTANVYAPNSLSFSFKT